MAPFPRSAIVDQPYGVLVACERHPKTADSMKSIDEHIQKDQSEIEAARAEGNEAKVRHLEGELKELKDYKEHHPGDNHDPTSLEMYCDANPDAPECRVYDD